MRPYARPPAGGGGGSPSPHLAALKSRILVDLTRVADRDTQKGGIRDLESIIGDLGPEGVPVLLSCLYDTSSQPKASARKESMRLVGVALAAHPASASAQAGRAMACLLRHFRDPDVAVRDAAADAVGQLVAALQAAAPATGGSGPAELATSLLDAASEKSRTVQSAACRALVRVASALSAVEMAEARLVPRLGRLLAAGATAGVGPADSAVSGEPRAPVLAALTSAVEAAGPALLSSLSPVLSGPCLELAASPDWPTRKAVAGLLQATLTTMGPQLEEGLCSRLMAALDGLRFDRVQPVRATALTALGLGALRAAYAAEGGLPAGWAGYLLAHPQPTPSPAGMAGASPDLPTGHPSSARRAAARPRAAGVGEELLSRFREAHAHVHAGGVVDREPLQEDILEQRPPPEDSADPDAASPELWAESPHDRASSPGEGPSEWGEREPVDPPELSHREDAGRSRATALPALQPPQPTASAPDWAAAVLARLSRLEEQQAALLSAIGPDGPYAMLQASVDRLEARLARLEQGSAQGGAAGPAPARAAAPAGSVPRPLPSLVLLPAWARGPGMEDLGDSLSESSSVRGSLSAAAEPGAGGPTLKWWGGGGGAGGCEPATRAAPDSLEARAARLESAARKLEAQIEQHTASTEASRA